MILFIKYNYEELEKLIHNNLKNSLLLMKKYKPFQYKSNEKVFLIRAKEDLKNDIEYHGWKKVIDSLQVVDTLGTHAYLFDYKHIKSTANVISCILRP